MPPFELYPAIDLAGGRLARLSGDDPAKVETRSGDPLDLARAYVSSGARWIHVVDLDAALSGIAANADLLERIAALPIRVQAGGGLSIEGVTEALRRGAARAILGAGSLGDSDAVSRAISTHGERVGVALDVRGPFVAPRGGHPVGPRLAEVLPLLLRLQPALLVYTDVDRDGRAAGPDLVGLARIAQTTRLPVLASGGVRSLADLAALAALAPAIVGTIVGRALHQGAFTLEEALTANAAAKGPYVPLTPA